MATVGTTYTRTGPTGDPAGRLADFARFTVEEMQEILYAGGGEIGKELQLAGASYRVVELAAKLSGVARRLAEELEAFTTAADD